MAEDKKKEQKVEKPSVPTAQIEVDGKKYNFTVATFRIIGKNDNQPILSKDAIKDETILAHLIEKKSAVLEEVKGGK
jgi:hypothetical protein